LNWLLDVLTQLVPLIFYIAFLYALHPSDSSKDKSMNTFHEENEISNRSSENSPKRSIPSSTTEVNKDLRQIELNNEK